MNTSLTRYFNRNLPSLFEEFDDVLSDFLKPALFKGPKMDMKEFDDKIEVSLDIPGFKKEDLDIKFENGWLSISGEEKAGKEEKNSRYIYREVGSRSFSRQQYIGNTFDSENINAKYENGILTIDLPKTEQTKFKKIEVK